MKITFSAFFAFLLLLQAMSAFSEKQEKLRALVSHYQFYLKQALLDHPKTLSCSDFIDQHYGNQNHDHDDNQEHSNLPARCMDVNSLFFLIEAPIPYFIQYSCKLISLTHQLISESFVFHTSLFVRDVFRPPLI